MKQKTPFKSPMGNCLTCFKVPPPGEAQASAPVEKDKEDILLAITAARYLQRINERNRMKLIHPLKIPATVMTGETSENKTKCVTRKLKKAEITDVQKLFHGHDGELHRHSLSALEHQINGNSRSLLATENCGSLHRDKSLLSFCSRIQPLGRTANNNEAKVKEVSEAKLIALYDNYKDLDSPDYILAEGIERLLSDLNLSPDEFKVLVLAWRLNAETMCQFSRDEFITGCKSMRTDSVKSISSKLSELSKEVLNDPELFKDLYRFTFRFGLDKSTGQRILPSDMAICLWKIVFSLKEPPILDRWLKFLESHPNIRGIPCDTWNMFLNLIETVGNDLSSYDDAEAWPSIFDDFVEFENDQMNQNISKEKEEIIQDCI